MGVLTPAQLGCQAEREKSEVVAAHTKQVNVCWYSRRANTVWAKQSGAAYNLRSLRHDCTAKSPCLDMRIVLHVPGAVSLHHAVSGITFDAGKGCPPENLAKLMPKDVVFLFFLT